jgi:hypothetical protein
MNPLTNHYRCSQETPRFHVAKSLKPNGYFRFGRGVVGYGQTVSSPSPTANGELSDVARDVHFEGNDIFLPFDPIQVANNLRYESYVDPTVVQRWVERSWIKDVYYFLRPLLPVSIRKHLQKIYLNGWDTIPFPSWPVDRSVDKLFERLLVLAMRSSQTDRLPFIWFWPKGHKACAIVTHDVETTTGRDFCNRLMDIDDSFGIKASFQVVPEKRYTVPPAYLASIRDRGFEPNVQGLDHEGNLFQNRETFLKSADKINKYARQFGSKGFRSPILYRKIEWLRELDFSYDMSVPNVARLEAQRGGCCTVMPYFLPGGMLELPVTMSEDYTVFHIINDYSLKLWREQMSVILNGNGLMSFIVHPDYVISRREQDVYKRLLEELSRLRSEQDVWVALPGEVDSWWRQRNEMRLMADGNSWRIEGPARDSARIAYARLDHDRLVYEID